VLQGFCLPGRQQNARSYNRPALCPDAPRKLPCGTLPLSEEPRPPCVSVCAYDSAYRGVLLCVRVVTLEHGLWVPLGGVLPPRQLKRMSLPGVCAPAQGLPCSATQPKSCGSEGCWRRLLCAISPPRVCRGRGLTSMGTFVLENLNVEQSFFNLISLDSHWHTCPRMRSPSSRHPPFQDSRQGYLGG
jgi:hypothetical protein